jgi:hypothetical protein
MPAELQHAPDEPEVQEPSVALQHAPAKLGQLAPLAPQVELSPPYEAEAPCAHMSAQAVAVTIWQAVELWQQAPVGQAAVTLRTPSPDAPPDPPTRMRYVAPPVAENETLGSVAEHAIADAEEPGHAAYTATRDAKEEPVESTRSVPPHPVGTVYENQTSLSIAAEHSLGPALVAPAVEKPILVPYMGTAAVQSSLTGAPAIEPPPGTSAAMTI